MHLLIYMQTDITIIASVNTTIMAAVAATIATTCLVSLLFDSINGVGLLLLWCEADTIVAWSVGNGVVEGTLLEDVVRVVRAVGVEGGVGVECA